MRNNTGTPCDCTTAQARIPHTPCATTQGRHPTHPSLGIQTAPHGLLIAHPKSAEHACGHAPILVVANHYRPIKVTAPHTPQNCTPCDCNTGHARHTPHAPQHRACTPHMPCATTLGPYAMGRCWHPKSAGHAWGRAPIPVLINRCRTCEQLKQVHQGSSQHVPLAASRTLIK
jgi:hypothetical protein